MKLLVSLSSYGDKNLHLMNQVIDTYKSFKKYEVNIDVHCTVPVNRSDINEIVHTNPPTTCLFHRKDFIHKQEDYDLFIFAEYDMLIKEECIDTYVKYDKILPEDYSLGFIRYENTPENDQYLIDLWQNIPNYNYIEDRSLKVNGVDYFTLNNVHQACYVLTQSKLKYVIKNTQYDVDSLQGHGPELASSGIFSKWPIGPRGIINKVLPLNFDDLNNCFIHHMADCHCNPPGVNSDPMTFRSNTVTKSSLFTDLKIDNKI
jgi:hypothetical protein